MTIGFFDSGIGGVTVLAEALKQMPEEDYIYYADTKHVPYGEKSKEEVRRYILDAADAVASRGVKALVVACNTATSIAVRELRDHYSFPVIGMEPAVKPAVRLSANREKRVLVFATSLTLKETKFKQLVSAVDPNHIVDSIALPGLVEFAERLVFDGNKVEQYLADKLSGFDLSLYGTVVLGCTHFPFFRRTLRKLLPPDIDLIDGAGGTVKHLRNTLQAEGRLGGGRSAVTFMTSGDGEAAEPVFRQAMTFAMENLND